MPNCGCYHRYKLAQAEPDAYNIFLSLEGTADVKSLLEDTKLALAVEVDHASNTLASRDTGVRLRGVSDVRQLAVFLDYLKSVIIVDLRPSIDHCYALGPYSLFPNDVRSLSEIGELTNRAKYHKDIEAAEDLSSRLLEFIDSHPILSKSTAIAVPPKSTPGPPDLPLGWAKFVTKEFGYETITVNKTRETLPQKNVGDAENEDDVVARIQDSFVVNPLPRDFRVLILDDTIGSGGTMIALARALRRAGATHVYGLSAAKDAKFTQGGINLDREVWG